MWEGGTVDVADDATLDFSAYYWWLKWSRHPSDESSEAAA